MTRGQRAPLNRRLVYFADEVAVLIGCAQTSVMDWVYGRPAPKYATDTHPSRWLAGCVAIRNPLRFEKAKVCHHKGCTVAEADAWLAGLEQGAA